MTNNRGKINLPQTEVELAECEAKGFWKAISLTKKIGESKDKITLETILHIHEVFFSECNPDIAGRFRKEGEDIKKLNCIEPPAGRLVGEEMYKFWRDLDHRISILPRHPKTDTKTQKRLWIAEVVDLAAWAQYKITSIHPFCEGNGRMSRLMTNLILYRFSLQPSPVKYEGENKTQYLGALCQIDNEGDYEPLKKMVAGGIFSTYQKIKKTIEDHSK